jgi:flavodoxin
MGRINFIDYKGKSILIEDFSNLRPGKEFMDTIEAAQKLIASRPLNSVLAVLDATGTHYDVDIIARMKDFVKANSPYIKNSAVVGVTGLLYIALNTLANAAGRKFPVFQTREEALEHLLKDA